MNARTFRASSLHDALRLVWQELGPNASVLTTEKKQLGLFARFTGQQVFEVTAQANGYTTEANGVQPQTVGMASNAVVDRSDATIAVLERTTSLPQVGSTTESLSVDTQAVNDVEVAAPIQDYRDRFRRFAVADQPESLLENMIAQHRPASSKLPSSLFSLFTDLLAADVDEDFARSLIETIEQHSTPVELSDARLVRQKTADVLASRIRTTPEISAHTSRRNVVALIGPTGVGKTTTVAKLAANLRLRDKKQVGLITVDTYRIAAVDQLRAYADIIDLPMEVVTTPREMRDAVAKLSDMDVVLVDTAGRSPRDEIQIQELKAMLNEAQADEVQLVLSSVSPSRQLVRLVEHFRIVNPTSILLTKLDEAIEYGHLLPVVCESGLPISYTTHGQNVPDDIQPANPEHMVERILEVV